MKKRLKQHNSGKTVSTKSNKPYDIVHFELFETRNEVVEREKYLKSGVGREYLNKTIDVKNAHVVQLDTCLPTGREYQISALGDIMVKVDKKDVLCICFEKSGKQ